MDDRGLPADLLTCLRAELGETTYASWFEHTARFTREGDVLRVAVPNRFAHDFLTRNYRAILERVAARVAGRALRVELTVDASLAGDELVSSASDSTDSFAPGADHSPESVAISLADARLSQIRAAPTLEQLVVGETNRLAFTAAQMTVERPGSVSPLLVYGTTAVGKTHLLRGSLSAALARRTVRRGAYVTAEQFTTLFVDALRGGGLPNFRRKFRDLELLLIDDVQFLIGKKHTLVELLHTITALESTGGQLVLSADRAPGELAEMGPELATRCQGGMVCRMQPPDLAMRRDIVGRLAAEQSLELPDDVRAYLAEQFTRHVRQLVGAIHRLQAASRARQVAVTLEMARAELMELIAVDSRPARLCDVERAVCATFGLERETLHATGRDAASRAPRLLAMWLARRYTRAGLAEIGRYFGGRSHSTVISAQKRVETLRCNRHSLEINGRHWNVDEALDRVADRLKVC